MGTKNLTKGNTVGRFSLAPDLKRIIVSFLLLFCFIEHSPLNKEPVKYGKNKLPN